jgi:spore coat protein U-like protein
MFWLPVSIGTLLPSQALAASCGLTGATSTSIGNYNPFSGSGFSQVELTLNLTRFRSGSGYTRRVNFYFVLPAGSPAYGIRYQGFNVLYTLPASRTLSLSSPQSGTVFRDFGGGSTDTISLPFTVTIPGNLDLSAGNPVIFDIRYICDGAGGMTSVSSPTTLMAAMTIKINVLSALQASYAGPALDFGEVGDIADAQAITRTATGNVRVASTGPFTVRLSSANGYRMTYPGGNVGNAAQSVRFSARFLGQTKSNAAQTFTFVACNRTGTGGQNLPITVALQEGGTAKVPAPDYLDTLTVTVTPLAVPFGGATVNCPGYQ